MFTDVVDTAPSRYSDPVESIHHVDISVQQKIIITVLHFATVPFSDEQVYRSALHRGFHASASGLRTRRKALQDAGYVQRVGIGRTVGGRQCATFTLTDKGRSAYESLVNSEALR